MSATIFLPILASLFLNRETTNNTPTTDFTPNFTPIGNIGFNDNIKLSIFDNVAIKSLKGKGEIYTSPYTENFIDFEFDVEFNNDKERKEWLYNLNSNYEIDNCSLIMSNGKSIDLCKEYPVSITGISAKKTAIKLTTTLLQSTFIEMLGDTSWVIEN